MEKSRISHLQHDQSYRNGTYRATNVFLHSGDRGSGMMANSYITQEPMTLAELGATLRDLGWKEDKTSGVLNDREPFPCFRSPCGKALLTTFEVYQCCDQKLRPAFCFESYSPADDEMKAFEEMTDNIPVWGPHDSAYEVLVYW